MAKTKQGTLRQQYSTATRARIIEAAGTVFAERGFHRATTRLIAEAAGTSEGALYRYFNSKRDLLVAVLESMIGVAEKEKEVPQAATDEFREIYTNMARERIKRIQPQSSTFLALMSDILTDRDLVQQIYKDMFMPALQSAEKLLQASIDRGNVRPLDVPLTARVVYGMAFGIDLLYMMGDTVIQSEIEKADKLAEIITTVVLDGIASMSPSMRKK